MDPETPDTFKAFVDRFPGVWQAQELGARAVEDAGPLDRKTRELIKIGICVGGNLQTALRRHVHQGLENGASLAEIEQAILLGINTAGFPAVMMAWKSAQEQVRAYESTGRRGEG